MKRKKKNTILKIFNLDKFVNKTIIVLFILLSVLIMKTINAKITTTLVEKIEEGIYYDFNLKEDGKRIKKYIANKMDNSKESLEEFTVEIFNIIK